MMSEISRSDMLGDEERVEERGSASIGGCSSELTELEIDMIDCSQSDGGGLLRYSAGAGVADGGEKGLVELMDSVSDPKSSSFSLGDAARSSRRTLGWRHSRKSGSFFLMKVEWSACGITMAFPFLHEFR